MNGWDEATMQTIFENCLHGAFECGVGLPGNGLRLCGRWQKTRAWAEGIPEGFPGVVDEFTLP